MRAGSRIVWRSEATEDGWNEVADVSHRPHLLDPWPGDKNVPRGTFLQQ